MQLLECYRAPGSALQCLDYSKVFIDYSWPVRSPRSHWMNGIWNHVINHVIFPSMKILEGKLLQLWCRDMWEKWPGVISMFSDNCNIFFPKMWNMSSKAHDDVINWKQFPRYWPFAGGIHRWISLTKASDAERWCFLWSTPEQTVEQILEAPVVWDTIALIMTSL